MDLWKSRRFWAGIVVLFFWGSPAWAHHMLGGELPNNFLHGFMSGLAHPIIGLDHLASIVAVGILGVLRPLGILVPIGFIVATTLGTGLHLIKVEFPFIELVIAASVLLFGTTIVLKKQPEMILIDLLAIGVGLFHGYAYGESIFGAETTPLLAYLAGFSLIQGGISIGVFLLAKGLSDSRCRSMGLIITGIGFSFFFGQLIEILLPGA